MGIENIIRPFASVNTAPRQGVSSLPQNKADISIMFGKGGAGKVLHGSYSITVTTYDDRHEQEQGVEVEA